MSDTFQMRLWTALAVATAGTALTFSQAATAQVVHDHGARQGQPILVQAQGGEGGEGGEMGAVTKAEGADALVTALGLVAGHLEAGMALAREDRLDLALTHMKHPEDEIYTDLLPMLQAAGAPDFAPELQALATAVEGGADLATIEAAHVAVMARIAEAQVASGATARQTLLAVQAVVRVAAEEYAIGVQGTEIVNLHEYQDAWGFLAWSRGVLGTLQDSPEPSLAEAAANALAALDAAGAAFDGVVPAGAVPGGPDRIAAAAALIEFTALGLPET